MRSTCLALLLLASCSSSSGNVKPDAPAGDGPTDAQIAGIVVAANEVDVAAGQQAMGMSPSPEVKDFAELMVRDHTAVNQQAANLVQKLGVTPEESDTSAAIRANGKATLGRLAALSSAAFEKAYVDNEVEYHQFVLSAMDGMLIPNARNEELKALLVQVPPAFQAHLEHAQGIQQKLVRP